MLLKLKRALVLLCSSSSSKINKFDQSHFVIKLIYQYNRVCQLLNFSLLQYALTSFYFKRSQSYKFSSTSHLFGNSFFYILTRNTKNITLIYIISTFVITQGRVGVCRCLSRHISRCPNLRYPLLCTVKQDRAKQNCTDLLTFIKALLWLHKVPFCKSTRSTKNSVKHTRTLRK